MIQNSEPPAWVWRLLGWSAVGLLLLAALGIAAISAGIFDPIPASVPILDQTERLVTTEWPDAEVAWTSHKMPYPGRIRLHASWQSGVPDGLYGLRLGDNETFLAVGVTPLQDLAIWLEAQDEQQQLLRRQPWPHVRAQPEANEIEVVANGTASQIWLNRELAWEGVLPALPDGIGFFVQSYEPPGEAMFTALSVTPLE